MAGSVSVESELGKGTTFKISFRTLCKITDNLLKDDCMSKEKIKEFEDVIKSSHSGSAIEIKKSIDSEIKSAFS
jgi:hypothetical protein